jgi:hypothetical protein
VEEHSPISRLLLHHKVVMIDGALVNLYAAARAYSTLNWSVLVSVLALLAAIVCLYNRNPPLAIIVLSAGQLLSGALAAIGSYQYGAPVQLPFAVQRKLPRALEPESKEQRALHTAVAGLIALVPLIGVSFTSFRATRIRMVFIALRLPVDMFGTGSDAIDAVSPAVCPQCGSDFDQQHGTVCPVCLSDVSDLQSDVPGDSTATPAHTGQGRLDRSAAYQSRTHCAVLASISFIIAAAQLIALATLKNRDLLFLIWSPAIPMAIIGGIVASRGKRALGAHDSADELAVALAMLLWPPFGGGLLIGMAVRLSHVITTGRAS